MTWDENDEANEMYPPTEFYDEMAKHCRCCSRCGNPPCDGVCAGGMCDEMKCLCDDDRDPYEREGTDGYEGGGG